MLQFRHKKLNKGFTLVELIIVIAILAIIMLIASVAYAGIQERMKIRSDKATCAQIGKALAVRETDLGVGKGIKLYPEIVEYDSLESIENYIKPGLTPQSMPDGGYIVTAIQTETGKKILVGIGKNGQEISTGLYNNKENAGWAWTEGKDISKFIDENTLKFVPNAVIKDILGEGEDGLELPSTIDSSAVTVGSYISYTGGNYTGKWVVLRNSGGVIQIISKDSVGILTLSGGDDYANIVKILNDKCKTYINSRYASSGRSVGATSSSIEQMDTTTNPLTFEAAGTRKLPYHDMYYQSDQTLIANNSELQHGTINTYNNDGYVVLATRHLHVNLDDSHFDTRYIDSNGTLGYHILSAVSYDGSTENYSYSYGVRPVITLKSGIRITGGTGTSDDPYTISI